MSERFGPYEVVRLLGKGGMGSVFEAVHATTGQRAAVKILNEQFSADPHFRARFESEIEAMKQVVHPNIVQLYAFGEQDGKLFYVMEMVEGASLQDRIAQGKRFTAYETAKIGVGICNALRMAHDRGIIHRDLKPANVMWDGGEIVKLTDFGIAKLFGGSQLTGEGGIIGTVEFMAPEQATGKPASVRSDLFSLGCVLFAMLSRRTPFAAKTIPEILHNVRYKEAPPVSDLVDGVPEPLEKLIEKLLSKDPQNRVPTALAVSKRLQEICAEIEPTTPAPKTIGGPGDSPGSSGAGKPSAESAATGIHDRVTRHDPEPSKPAPPAGKTAGGAAPVAGGQTAADGATVFEPKRTPEKNAPAKENRTVATPAAAQSTQATGEFVAPARPAAKGPAPKPAGPAGATGVGGATAEFTRPVSNASAPANADSHSFELGPGGTVRSRGGQPGVDGEGESSRFTTVEEERARRLAEEPTAWDTLKRSLLIAVPLGLAFVALLVAIVLFAMPASADDLYSRIMQQVGPLEPIQYAVAIPDIDEFVRRFPDDSRAQEVAALKEDWSAAKKRKSALPAATGDPLALRPPVQRIYEEALARVGSDPVGSLADLDNLLLAFDERSAGEAGKEYLASAKQLRDELAKTLDEQRKLERGVIQTRIADEKKRLATDQAPAARKALTGLADLYADEPWAADLAAEARSLAEAESPAP